MMGVEIQVKSGGGKVIGVMEGQSMVMHSDERVTDTDESGVVVMRVMGVMSEWVNT